MYNGLPEKLIKEIKVLAHESMKEGVKAIFSPEKKFAVWIGDPFFPLFPTLKECGLQKLNKKNMVLQLFIENLLKSLKFNIKYYFNLTSKF